MAHPADDRSSKAFGRWCPTCFRSCLAVAETSYFVGLQETRFLWLCPPCFDSLNSEVIGLELTGHILGDPEAFGRKRR